MPALHLSRWLPWRDRGSLPDLPGIYLIGTIEPEQVIYIGRTWNEGGLKTRVSQFHRSATTGKKGHSGGVTFNGLFEGDVSGLQVRVHHSLTISQAPEILRPYIEYAERRLIWEFVEEYGRLPMCNSE